jgi:hypothetical protein
MIIWMVLIIGCKNMENGTWKGEAGLLVCCVGNQVVIYGEIKCLKKSGVRVSCFEDLETLYCSDG